MAKKICLSCKQYGVDHIVSLMDDENIIKIIQNNSVHWWSGYRKSLPQELHKLTFVAQEKIIDECKKIIQYTTPEGRSDFCKKLDDYGFKELIKIIHSQDDLLTSTNMAVVSV